MASGYGGRALLFLCIGVIAGGLTAFAYYVESLKPLAHAFSPWVFLTALVSARRPPGGAACRSVLFLLSAVFAFYFGKDLVYKAKYPGMPYEVNVAELAQWLFLALACGVVLGFVFHKIGTSTRAGLVGAASAVGLVLADTYRGSSSPGKAALLMPLALGASLVLAGLTVHSRRDAVLLLSLVVPFAGLGLLIISLPDLVQRLLLVGHF